MQETRRTTRERQVLVAIGRVQRGLQGNHQSQRVGRLLFCSVPPLDGHYPLPHLGPFLGHSSSRQFSRH